MERVLRKAWPGGVFHDVPLMRSAAMRAVKSKGNLATESRFRFALVSRGISGWRVHPIELPGRPDFVFSTSKVAVFVDGCFWHGCPRCGHVPHTRSGFWRAKIERNKDRDRRAGRNLRKLSYRVVRFWECELRAALDNCIASLLLVLNRPTRRQAPSRLAATMRTPAQALRPVVV